MPMELSLWRHLGGWTKLTLEPQRRVYIKGSYFDTGHRALNVLCNQLVRELDAHASSRQHEHYDEFER